MCGGGLSKHNASAVTDPFTHLSISWAVAFHPSSVAKGSKDLIITKPVVSKLPLRAYPKNR